MEQSLEKELLQRMKQSKYLLTILNHRSIEKIQNGFIGFQITQGLVYKLRVFLLKREGENKIFKILFQEWFGREQTAKDKMHELLQQYKKQ
ncbi:unnamed protein product [Paramecium primaurelia]|uniref:Uncharacterized protein n=2 Tax=Paramecium TaxID=5884 RepID=A0A8S1UFK7_9CILI|nr:unnamed protein product [Paramecium primaurelia]CAD8162492.1 unnamed protein product [Paramecium pentaurelia]